MLFLMLFFSAFLLAQETTPAAAAKMMSRTSGDYSAIRLAECRPRPHKKDGSEESLAREEAEKHQLPKEEILARLIYSELLSTGYWNHRCRGDVGLMMEGIGWGVMKRVQDKSRNHLDPYAEAIFAKLQFRTSFSSKKQNPFAASFLCPLRSQDYLDRSKKGGKASDLYAAAQKIAKEIISIYETRGIPHQYKGITNFFYPQSEFFGEQRPGWAANKDPRKNKGYVNLLGVDEKPCIEFYRL